MTGQVTFLDEPTGWGLILGDDGRVYVLRRRDTQAPVLRPGDPVAFEPLATRRGMLAVAVQRRPAAAGAPPS
jgi:cold shock CspA family protein